MSKSDQSVEESRNDIIEILFLVCRRQRRDDGKEDIINQSPTPVPEFVRRASLPG